MTARRYTRRVSPLERYSLVINALYRYHVDGIVEGRGEIDPVALQGAVERAAAANPAIRVRLRGALGWSRWVDSGIAPQVRLLPTADWDGRSERGADFLEQRLEPLRGGPVADLLVVPCRDGRTRIVFRSVHAAIDGRGIMHWMAEVFRALRGETLAGSTSTLIDLDIQAQYRDRIPPETPPAQPVTCLPVLAPPATPPPALRYVWRRVLLDSNVPQLLPKTAAFLAAWARRRASGEVGFTIPVDYRGLRTDEMGIGNLTGYLRLSVAEDATPRSLMVQLGRRIKDYADCRQFPGIKVLLWTPIWWMLRQTRPKVDHFLYHDTPAFPSGGVVSMGTVELPDYSTDRFRAESFYGIPGAVGKLNVIFVNTADAVSVQFAAPSGYNAQGQLDALVDAYRQHFSIAAEVSA